jgi:hypothetical protein
MANVRRRRTWSRISWDMVFFAKSFRPLFQTA